MTDLPLRTLGDSDLQLTRTGLGAWAIGGGDWAFGWGSQEDKASIAAIHYAVDRGINWIDTAATYGLGHSEEVVGEALRQLGSSHRPYVFTKCGLVWDDADRSAPPRRDLRPESIRKECDASLRRIGVDAIDLYQFHWPDENGTAVEDSWGVMLDLVVQGKIRYGGVSNFDVDLLARCERVGHVTSLQPPLSLVNREAARELVPWCATHQTGVIAYSPMQSGLLTDRFTRDRVDAMDAGDWRRRSPDFQEPGLSRNLALRDALTDVAERHHTTIASVAIAWDLAWPGVTATIVGARSPEQIDGWIDAARVALTADDLDHIAEAIVDTGAGTGPTRPGA